MRQFRPEAVRDAVTVREAQAAKRAELAAAADAAEPDHTMIIGTQESRESTRVALEIVRDLAASCYGPSGRPKLIRANESGGEDGGTRGPQIRMVSAAAVGYGGSSSASVGSGPQLQGQDVESMLKRTAATAAVAAISI